MFPYTLHPACPQVERASWKLVVSAADMEGWGGSFLPGGPHYTLDLILLECVSWVPTGRLQGRRVSPQPRSGKGNPLMKWDLRGFLGTAWVFTFWMGMQLEAGVFHCKSEQPAPPGVFHDCNPYVAAEVGNNRETVCRSSPAPPNSC